MADELDFQSASPAQREVILSDSNRLVVSASAGSGKTWTIAQRYLKHVIQDGIQPREILCVTFTRKAAAEMRARIIRFFDSIGRADLVQKAEAAPIGTIHSLCERLIQENAVYAEIDPDFEIQSADESLEWERQAIEEAIRASSQNKSVQALLAACTGSFAYRSQNPYDKVFQIVVTALKMLRTTPVDITELRQRYQSPESYAESLAYCAEPVRPGKDPKEVVTSSEAALSCGVFRLADFAQVRLESRMMNRAKADYFMLESLALKLLSHPEVSPKVSQKCRVLIVDESQDLNPMQMAILEKLGADKMLFVGDENQSIYGFRQAAPELFRKLGEEWDRLPLSENRRTVNPILKEIDQLFEKQWGSNYAPMAKKEAMGSDGDPFAAALTEPAIEVWPQNRQYGGPVQEQLAQTAADGIAELVRNGEPLRDIGVLTRSWTAAKHVKTHLQDRGIPCRVTDGPGLFLRLESRDLANALMALTDPLDDFALLTTLRGPLVDLSMDAIAVLSLDKRLLRNLDEVHFENPEDAQKLTEFLDWWTELQTDAGRLTAAEVIDRLIKKGDLLVKLASRPRSAETIANVRKLLTIAARRPSTDANAFAEYLKGLQKIKADVKDAETLDEDSNVVTITSIHQAKGLEWPIVVLAETTTKFESKEKEIVTDRDRMEIVVSGPKGTHGLAWVKILKDMDAREKSEGQRMLYTALTRAARRLIVTVPLQTPQNTFAGWLKPFTQEAVRVAKAADLGAPR